MAKLTRESLKALSGQNSLPGCSFIKVGMSSCGVAAGARVVYDFLKQEVEKRFPHIAVRQCGCNIFSTADSCWKRRTAIISLIITGARSCG